MRKQVELPSGLNVVAHYTDSDYPSIHSYSCNGRWVQPDLLARHECESRQFIEDYIEAEVFAQMVSESENRIWEYADYMYDISKEEL